MKKEKRKMKRKGDGEKCRARRKAFERIASIDQSNDVENMKNVPLDV
jgi:hypothetical protein